MTKLQPCSGKAFPPLSHLDELGSTRWSVEDCIKRLRREYNVAKTRQLMYLLYDPAENQPVRFTASQKGIFILSQIVAGKKYKEIAQLIGCSTPNIDRYIEKMCDDNNCQNTDELIIMYADWNKRNE